MPKGPRKKAAFKQSSLSIALLLVKFILIEIGNLPFLLIQTLWDKIFTIVKFLSKKRIPTLRFTLLSFPIPRLHRKRGRPKKLRLPRPAIMIVGLSVFLIFLISYTAFILTAAYQLPTPTRLTSLGEPLTSEFYDRNGNLLYRLYESKNRSLVKLSEIPPHLIQATIAIEDQNFYRHFGIDPVAIFRALYHNLRNGTQEGASTLTQQLIKNSLLTSEKSYSRKLREMILALWTERIYSKDEILQMYFNEAPYGGANVGIAAASQAYFGKSPLQLSLAESAYLAGLPVSPTQFSPYGSEPQLVKLRQKEVLERMVKERYITQDIADKAFKEDLNVKLLSNNILAPHFVFYIRGLLAQKYGTRVISQGGLKVYTTLDLKLQERTEKIVKEEIEKLSGLNVQNGAAMVLDARNAQILAMAGSRDYHYPGFGNFNVALSLRQPGSSIKPITYATAFKKGFSPANLILDTPVTFRDAQGNQYSPVNYDGRFHGPVTLRQALGNSFNIPAVKLLATVGVEEMIQTAKDLGITTFEDPERFGLSLTLGGGEVKMIEMMGVYQAFSGNGVAEIPTGILKVTDSKGQILEEYKDSGKQAISPQIAYLVTHILSDNNARSLAFGTNSLLNIPGFQVAVKTGTSDNKRDNWTFGYTPGYVVGVWVGNPDNSPMNPRLASGITGAAPIWNRIMHTLLDGTKPLVFERPTGITELVVDGRQDLSLADTTPKSLVKITKEEEKVIFTDAFSSYTSPLPEKQAGPANPELPNL